MRAAKIIILFFMLLAFSACGSNARLETIPVQHWRGMDIRIEPHPNPPLQGMSDVMVIVTGAHGRPISNLTISLRGDPTMPWVQAIQDGFIGVYRRGIDLGSGEHAVVEVKLQQGGDETVLRFPLKLEAG
jgi:hypothetical protein